MMTRKIKVLYTLSIVFSLIFMALIMSMFIKPSNSEVSATSGKWNDYTATISATDKDGYYLISTPGQLATFNNNMSTYKNKNIRLAAHINMTDHYWVPNQSYSFAGIFDGQGYTISNIVIDGSSATGYLGLFGKLDYGAQVRDLFLKNCSITKASGHAGILCGYMEGANGKAYSVFNIHINDCTISYTGNSNKNNTVKLGSVTGFAYSSIIKSCYVTDFYSKQEGNRPGIVYAGGIAGQAGNLTISTCLFLNTKANYDHLGSSNYTLTAIATNESYIGGIVGELTYFNSKTTTLIEKCSVKGGGILYANSDTSGKQSCAGGIAGMLNYGTIQNCSNETSIYSYSKDVKSGNTTFSLSAISWTDGWYKEISGTAKGTYWVCPATRSDSKAKGSYKTTTSSSYYYHINNPSYSGGIAGIAQSGTTIKYCFANYKYITAGQDYYEHVFAFKILKRAAFNVHHYNWNVSTITVKGAGYYHEGGIIGANKGASISSCYNAKVESDRSSSWTDEGGMLGFVTKNTSSTCNFICFRSSASGANVTITVENGANYFIPNSYGEGAVLGSEYIDNTSSSAGFTYSTTVAQTSTNRYSSSSTDINAIVTANSSVWVKDSDISSSPIIKDLYWEHTK